MRIMRVQERNLINKGESSMRKRIVSMVLTTMMVVSLLAGCSSNEKQNSGKQEAGNEVEQSNAEAGESTAKEVKTVSGKKLTKIGFSAPAMDNEFMTNLESSLKETAAEYGVEVVTSNAEQNTAKQAEQIENMVTMGCEAICVSPVDLDSILDVLKKVKSQGVTISLCGVIPESKDYYDVVANVEQFDLGQSAAKAASEWIDKTFPDAADGSIEVALLTLDNSAEAKKRAEGLRSIEELNKKVKIVGAYDSTGSSSIPTKAQEYAEMMLIEHPNVKCVLTYSDFMGLPADEVIMRTPSIKKEEFGIFGCDYSEAACEAVKKSETNESVYRGSGAFGVKFGKTMFDTVVGNVEFDDLGVYYEPAFELSVSNVDEYLK